MPLKILLADDHQIIRQSLKALLEQKGFAVVGEASDGHEAVRLANEKHPDVAVLDLSMPLLNGIDAARQIRHDLPGTNGHSLNHAHRRAIYPGRRPGGNFRLCIEK